MPRHAAQQIPLASSPLVGNDPESLCPPQHQDRLKMFEAREAIIDMRYETQRFLSYVSSLQISSSLTRDTLPARWQKEPGLFTLSAIEQSKCIFT